MAYWRAGSFRGLVQVWLICECTGATAMSCSNPSTSQHSSSCTSHNSFCLLFQDVPWALERIDVDGPFQAKHSPVACSEYFDQLWVSTLTSTVMDTLLHSLHRATDFQAVDEACFAQFYPSSRHSHCLSSFTAVNSTCRSIHLGTLGSTLLRWPRDWSLPSCGSTF